MITFFFTLSWAIVALWVRPLFVTNVINCFYCSGAFEKKKPHLFRNHVFDMHMTWILLGNVDIEFTTLTENIFWHCYLLSELLGLDGTCIIALTISQWYSLSVLLCKVCLGDNLKVHWLLLKEFNVYTNTKTMIIRMFHIKYHIIKYLFSKEDYYLFQFTVKIDCLIEAQNEDAFSGLVWNRKKNDDT